MEIFIDRDTQLEIDVKVAGADGKKFQPEVRLSLISEGVRLSFPAKQTMGNGFAVKIPALAGKIELGECDMEVEVFVDGKHFVPIRGTATLKEELKPVVEFRSQPKPTSDQVTLTASVKKREVSETSSAAKTISKPRPAPAKPQLIKKGVIRQQA